MKKTKPPKSIKKSFAQFLSGNRVVVFVALFATIGIAALIIVNAAGPTASIEPENATVTSPATTCTDSNASGGSCVQFKKATTTTLPNCTIYASVSGGGNGSSQSTPTTLSSAMSAASTGGVVCLNAGSYGTVTLAKGITLRSTTGQTAVLTKITISAGNSAIINLEITGGSDPLVRVNAGVADVLIKGNKIHDGTGNGMRTMGNRVTIQDNEMYHFLDEDAIRLWGDGVVIRNNYIHDVIPGNSNAHNDPFQTWCLASDGCAGPALSNLTIEDNIIVNFPGGDGHCIMSESNLDRMHDWKIIRNKWQDIGAHCIMFGGGEPNDLGVLNVELYYNKFINVGGNTIECNFQTTGKLFGNTYSNANSRVIGTGSCPILPSAPAGISPTRPNYDVTWPVAF